jgi:hypothetical protein
MRGGAPGVTRKRPRPSRLTNAPTKIIGSAYERHEPARPSGADVRAEDKTQPLRKGQQARTDQSDRRHGRRVRRLHEERGGWRPRTRDRGVAATLPSTVRSDEPASALKPLGHHGHAEQEQPTPPRIEIVVDMNPAHAGASRAASRTGFSGASGPDERRGDNSRRLG